MWAAAANNAAAVEALVDAGADVQARTKFKPVPLVDNRRIGRRAERNSDATKQAGFTALHFAVRAGAADAVKVLLKSGATRARHDVGRHRRAGDGDRQHALRAGRLAAGAGRRPERGRARLDAAAPDRLHAPAEHRREQPRARAHGTDSTASTLARKLLARGANPNQPATKNPDVTNVGRKRLTEAGADTIVGCRADAGSALHAAAGRPWRRSAAAEQHRRHAAAGGVRTGHREAGRESRDAGGSRRGREVPARSRRRCHDRRCRRQHRASRRRRVGLERGGRPCWWRPARSST